MPTLHDFSATSIEGEEIALSVYAGKVVLIANVASRCSLTPQYDGLQRLYEIHAGEDLEILGFPCNQFGSGEPDDEPEIKAFCSKHFGVTFPLFSKIDVNGEHRHPLFAWLCAERRGPDGAGDVAWNFAKFLIDKRGTLIARFSPQTEPQNADLVAGIRRNLVHYA